MRCMQSRMRLLFSQLLLLSCMLSLGCSTIPIQTLFDGPIGHQRKIAEASATERRLTREVFALADDGKITGTEVETARGYLAAARHEIDTAAQALSDWVTGTGTEAGVKTARDAATAYLDQVEDLVDLWRDRPPGDRLVIGDPVP